MNFICYRSDYRPHSIIIIIPLMMISLLVLTTNSATAQTGFSPTAAWWNQLPSQDPLGLGSLPAGSRVITGSGSPLTEGLTTDSGMFVYRSTGEGKIVQAVISPPTSGSGSAGIMIRDGLNPDSAFVFLGRDSSGALTLKLRPHKAQGIQVIELLDATGAPITSHGHLRIVAGRDAAYVYSSANRFVLNSGNQNWTLRGAFPLDLTGADYAGVFAGDAVASITELIETNAILWSERTSTQTNATPSGSWSQSPGLTDSFSSQIFSHPHDPSSADSVSFPLDINITGTHDLFIHCLPEGSSSIDAEIWIDGAFHSSVTLPAGPPDVAAWAWLGAFSLARNQDCAVKLLASSGSPGESVIADAVRTVYRDKSGAAPTHWVKDGNTSLTRISNNNTFSATVDRKSATNESWTNSGAHSLHALLGDGVVQFRIARKPSPRFCFGLSDTPGGPDKTTIRWRFFANDTAVTIAGLSTPALNFNTDTVFSIERIGDLLIFRKNSSLQGYSSLKSTNPLYLDTSFRDYEAKVKSTKAYGTFDYPSYLADKDGDGIDDADEQTVIDFNLEDEVQNVFDIDPGGDLDFDGMDNVTELNHGTNLLLEDTDGDHLSDYDEIYGPVYANGTTSALLADTDHDGLTDKLESDLYASLGFDPTLPNSDAAQDEVSDYTEWEILTAAAASQDPDKNWFVSQADIDGTLDWDEDGVSDLHESVDGTSAVDQDDYFREILFGQFGQSNRALPAYETNDGVTSTRLSHDAGALPSGLPGGISHHYLRDGSRIRFSFGEICHGSSVGIVALRDARAGIPAPLRIEASEVGNGIKEATFIGGLDGQSFTFPIATDSLLEIHFEMNDQVQRVKIGKDFQIIQEIDIPEMDLGAAPVVVSAALGDAGSEISNSRYRWLYDPDQDDDGLPDLWEEQLIGYQPQLLSVYDIEGSVDYDGDGVTAFQEWKSQTSPIDPLSVVFDLDGDQLINANEIELGSNPADPGNWEVVSLDHGYVHANDCNQAVSFQEIGGDFRLMRYTAGVWSDLGSVGQAEPLDIKIGLGGDIAGTIPAADGSIQLFRYTGGQIEYPGAPEPVLQIHDVAPNGTVLYSATRPLPNSPPLEKTEFFLAPKSGDPESIAAPDHFLLQKYVGFAKGELIVVGNAAAGDLEAEPFPSTFRWRLENWEEISLPNSIFVAHDLNNRGDIAGLNAVANWAGIIQSTEAVVVSSDEQTGATSATALGVVPYFDSANLEPLWLDIDDTGRVTAFVPGLESDPQTNPADLGINADHLAGRALQGSLVSVANNETAVLQTHGRYFQGLASNNAGSLLGTISPIDPNDGTLSSPTAAYSWNDSRQDRPVFTDAVQITDSGAILSGDASGATLTRRDVRDADNDGFSDDWEQYYSFDKNTVDDPFTDSDGDQLSDLVEYWIYTNPHSSDSDGDQMGDAWESAHGFDPLSPDDSAIDSDGDGLSNLIESQAGTNPYVINIDTDGDQMTDFWEFTHGLSITEDDAALDQDLDGLSNLMEFQLDTIPTQRDSDSDGVIDSMEVLADQTDPNDPLDLGPYRLYAVLEAGSAREVNLVFENTLNRSVEYLVEPIGNQHLGTDTQGNQRAWVQLPQQSYAALPGSEVSVPVTFTGVGFAGDQSFSCPIRVREVDGGLILSTHLGISIRSAQSGATDASLLSQAFIHADNRPAFDALPIEVDADQDGMADDWERRNGLDPADPADAWRDYDYDRLINRIEFERNTVPVADWNYLPISPREDFELHMDRLALRGDGSIVTVVPGETDFEIHQWNSADDWTTLGNLGLKDDFTVISNVVSNEFGLIAAAVGKTGPDFATVIQSQVRILDDEGNVVVLGDGGDDTWLRVDRLWITNSGIVAGIVDVELADSSQATKLFRWRNGFLDMFDDGAGVLGISERGEFAHRTRGVLQGEDWIAQDGEVLAIGPYGKVWTEQPDGNSGASWNPLSPGVNHWLNRRGDKLAGIFSTGLDHNWGSSALFFEPEAAAPWIITGSGSYDNRFDLSPYLIEPGENQSFSYSHEGGGNYTFVLETTDENGDVSQEVTTADLDIDDDGWSDTTEAGAGTDPGDPDSFPGSGVNGTPSAALNLSAMNDLGDVIGWRTSDSNPIFTDPTHADPAFGKSGFLWRTSEFALEASGGALGTESQFLKINNSGHILVRKVDYISETEPYDSDGDGIDDTEIDTGFLNPEISWALLVPDNDADDNGLPDDWETLFGVTDPSDDGEDLDELNAAVEYILGTHPQTDDTDSDDIPDSYELVIGNNPLDPGDRDLDNDFDSLTNYYEYRLQFDGLSTDSDRDGIPDLVEANGDGDGDGLPYAYELLWGLSDDDDSDAGLDFDFDGKTNLEEYHLDTTTLLAASLSTH